MTTYLTIYIKLREPFGLHCPRSIFTAHIMHSSNVLSHSVTILYICYAAILVGIIVALDVCVLFILAHYTTPFTRDVPTVWHLQLPIFVLMMDPHPSLTCCSTYADVLIHGFPIRYSDVVAVPFL